MRQAAHEQIASKGASASFSFYPPGLVPMRGLSWNRNTIVICDVAAPRAATLCDPCGRRGVFVPLALAPATGED